MKRSLTFLILMLMYAGLHAQPKLNFASTRYDYGTIREEAGKQEAVFNFTNTGDSVLVITRVQSSCGCTAADYTKSPVPPGGKGLSRQFSIRGATTAASRKASRFIQTESRQ